MRLIDLTGQNFGRLTVIERAPNNKSNHTMWKCVCNCSEQTECVVSGNRLRQGITRSCGCFKKENLIERNKTHCGTGTRLYMIWANMKSRCHNQKRPDYQYYCGKGITVCSEWQEFKPFYDWAMANGYQDDLTIERIDVNGNYEPNNCKWATNKEQANNKISNHLITYKGEVKTLTEWCEHLGIKERTVSNRIHKLKWEISKAFETPIRKLRKDKGNGNL